MTIIFQTTYDCNLRCTYCYQHNKRHELLNIKDAFLLIDKLFDWANNKNENIFSIYVKNKEEILSKPFVFIFFGGEATLELKLIELICDYFHKKCDENNFQQWWETFTFRIDSNGVNYTTNPDIHRLVEKYGKHIGFSITLDGCKESHDLCRIFPNGQGSFDYTLKAVEQYKKDFGFTPLNKITFSPDNVKFLQKSIQTLIELGYPGTMASYDEFMQMTVEQSEEFYQALKSAIDYILETKPSFALDCILKDFMPGRRGSMCGSYGDMITISPGGYLSCCQSMTPSLLEGEVSFLGYLGDVKNGIANNALLDYMRDQQFMKASACATCPIEQGCDSCPATNLAKTGYLFLDWHNCGATVAEARAQLYLKQRIEELGLQKEALYYEDLKENHYDPNYQYLMYTVFKKDTD